MKQLDMGKVNNHEEAIILGDEEYANPEEQNEYEESGNELNGQLAFANDELDEKQKAQIEARKEKWIEDWQKENPDKEFGEAEQIKMQNFINTYERLQIGNKRRENIETTLQFSKTMLDTATSIAGLKSLYSVPEYLRERFMVKGIMGKGKGVEGSIEELLTSSQKMHKRIPNKESEDAQSEDKKVKEAIDDLNKRLKLTKEGSVKGSEQRKMIAKLLKENRKREKLNEKERHEEITKILDDYTTTKTTGIQVARDSLNTFFVASGAFAVRGLSYGVMDGVERYQNLNKEARKKGENVSIIKDVIVGGIKKTWKDIEAAIKDKEKSKAKRFFSVAIASSKIARYVGIGAMMKWHPENMEESIEKALDALQGRVSLGDAVNNFKHSIERLPKFIKSLGPTELHAAEIPNEYTSVDSLSSFDRSDLDSEKLTDLEADKDLIATKVKDLDNLSLKGIGGGGAEKHEEILKEIAEIKSKWGESISVYLDIPSDIQAEIDMTAKGSEDTLTGLERERDQWALPNSPEQDPRPLSGLEKEREDYARGQSEQIDQIPPEVPCSFKENFELKLGKGNVPAQLERVFHMMSVDAMKNILGDDHIFGEEEGAKSLNVAANLVELAKGNNVPGIRAEEIKEIFSYDSKENRLEIKNSEKFNELVKKLHDHSNKLWADEKLQRGAAAYLDDIRKGTWEKIIKAEGLESEVGGHDSIDQSQIKDFEKSEMVKNAEEELAKVESVNKEPNGTGQSLGGGKTEGLYSEELENVREEKVAQRIEDRLNDIFDISSNSNAFISREQIEGYSANEILNGKIDVLNDDFYLDESDRLEAQAEAGKIERELRDYAREAESNFRAPELGETFDDYISDYENSMQKMSDEEIKKLLDKGIDIGDIGEYEYQINKFGDFKNAEAIKGLVGILKEDFSRENFEKVFGTKIESNNFFYSPKDGIVKIKDLIVNGFECKKFDLVVDVNGGKIKFGIDGPTYVKGHWDVRNYSMGGKSLLSHIDIPLTQKNIKDAMSATLDMAREKGLDIELEKNVDSAAEEETSGRSTSAEEETSRSSSEKVEDTGQPLSEPDEKKAEANTSEEPASVINETEEQVDGAKTVDEKMNEKITSLREHFPKLSHATPKDTRILEEYLKNKGDFDEFIYEKIATAKITENEARCLYGHIDGRDVGIKNMDDLRDIRPDLWKNMTSYRINYFENLDVNSLNKEEMARAIDYFKGIYGSESDYITKRDIEIAKFLLSHEGGDDEIMEKINSGKISQEEWINFKAHTEGVAEFVGEEKDRKYIKLNKELERYRTRLQKNSK